MALSPLAIIRRIAATWRTAPYPGPVTTMGSGNIAGLDGFGINGLEAALEAAGGPFVSQWDAVRLATVHACGQVIAKSIGSCDWQVFMQAADGTREQRPGSTVYRLLNIRPNPLSSPIAWREAMLLQAVYFGNAFAEIERDGYGRPVGLWVIPVGQAQLIYQGGGSAIVRVTGVPGGQVDLDYADVFHLRGPGLDGLEGADMLTQAMRVISQASAAERFAAAFYRNNAQFGGIFTADLPMDADARKELREAINAKHQGADRAFRFAILDGGMKFQQFPLTPDKAQFIETREFLVNETCRYFGVPPHKVQHLKQATFTNIEQQNIEFSRDCLTPWAERLRQEADYKLLPGAAGFRSRIDLDWLSEGDSATRAAADVQLVNNGLLSRNEARARRGLNGIGKDGDAYTVQAQMVDLSKLDEPAPAPTPATPPTPATDPATNDNAKLPNREVATPPKDQAGTRRPAALLDVVERHLARQGAAVASAEERATSPAEFVQLVGAAQLELAAPFVRELAEAADDLDAVGEVRRVMEEDMRLVGFAKAEGDVSGWCDPAARAVEIVERMTQ